MNQIDATLREMPAADQPLVKAWLEKSYNRNDEIQEMIRAAPKDCPSLVLECPTTYTPQQILEVARSAHPKVLAQIGELMTNLRQVPAGSPLPERYLPVGMSDMNLFELLPHLMAPGTMFSLRPAIVMAAIATITNNALLKDRAAAFMNAKKGKWFDAEVPENFTFEFVRLAMKIAPFLTDQEKSLFTFLQTIAGLMMNGNTEICCEQAFAPLKTKHADVKRKCVDCRQLRSFTLMTADDRCGLCLFDKKYGEESVEKCDESTSVLCECRQCHALYAVVNLQLLNVEPKCHYCRNGRKEVPVVTCTKCTNAYIAPSSAEKNATFECPQCVVNAPKSIVEHKVPLRLLLEQNSDVVLSVLGVSKLPEGFNIWGGHTLFKLKEKLKSAVRSDPNVCSALILRGKKVRNSPDVLRAILQWVMSGSAEEGSCMLCFGDFPRAQLLTVCGHRQCQTVACKGCLGHWYGASKPGEIVLPSHLSCPFCKRPPTVRVLGAYNRPACALLQAKGRPFEPTWYYAWCTMCYHLIPHTERACAAGGPPHVANFVCNVCRSPLTVENKKVMNCPGCKAPTIKESGCDHITCPCGVHWCYQCGEAHEEYTIYDHMSSAHGGIYNDQDD